MAMRVLDMEVAAVVHMQQGRLVEHIQPHHLMLLAVLAQQV
jgi:hypothetical protein